MAVALRRVPSWIVAVVLVACGLVVAPRAQPVAAATSTLTPTVHALGVAAARDLVVDPGTGRVFVSGDDEVVVRGPDGAAVGVVPGLPGAGTLLAAAGKVFVLRRAAATVVRIDPVTLQVTGSWSVAPLSDPMGLAHTMGRLWTTARSSASAERLVSIDPVTGAVVVEYDGPSLDLLGALRASPTIPGLLVGATLFSIPGRMQVIDVSGDEVVLGGRLSADGGLGDLAFSPDGTKVVVAAGQDSVEERAVPSLDETGTRYPTLWHERAVATTEVGSPGSLVAVADLGLISDLDLWIHNEGDPVPRRQATVHTSDREIVEGAMEFGAGGSRLYVARQAQVPTSDLEAELLVYDVGPDISGVSPRVVGTTGGGQVTVRGSGLAGASVRVGGRATTGSAGTGGARTVSVASLPEGFAPVEASNALGVTSASPTPVVVRDLGPFADSAGFADRQHRDLLGRAATVGERLAADSALGAGGSLGALPVALVRSAPSSAERAPVVRLYQAIFLRPPDTAGLEYWVRQIEAGRSLTWVASAMAAAPEFRARYGSLSDRGFVERIYLNVLGRAAEPAGRDYWVGVLASGRPRGVMVVGFSQSPEYRARTAVQVDVTNLYLGMLRRTPTSSQLAAALTTAASGSVEAVAAGIVTSAEYRARIG